MAEPTISTTLDGLRSTVGYFCGFGRTYSSVGSDDQATINAAIADGLRRFYAAREWNFLRPWLTLMTTASVETVTLPEGVGFVESDLYYDNTVSYSPVCMRSVDYIMSQRSGVGSGSTGIPTAASLRPKFSDNIMGQRSELIFYPCPSDVWTLSYRARILPDLLTTDKQYSLGSAAHARTLQMACLAEADLQKNDNVGNYQAMFDRELQNSIEYDAKAYAPRSLGRLPVLLHNDAPGPSRIPLDATLEYTG